MTVLKEKTIPFAPWVNDDIREAKRRRNNIRIELKSDRQNITLQEQFKQEKEHVKTLITAGESEYYRKQLQDTKGDTSKTWEIKNIVPNRKSNSNGFHF